MRDDIHLINEYWSKADCSVSDKNFYRFPPIRARSCRLIFDEYDIIRTDWCQYWTVEKYLKSQIPFDKCLSICCGFGEVERILAKLGVAKRFIGVDIAEGAIKEAKKRAEAENLSNIEYIVSDLNHTQIPSEEYDLIYANGALHHIADLEYVIPMLYRALKPGGYLVSNEYVGPKYQQIGLRQREIINAIKHILPSDLRTKNVVLGPFGSSVPMKFVSYVRQRLQDFFYQNSISSRKIYAQLWDILPIEYFLATDPSECVNSDKIIPTLKKYFDDVDVRYFNGSILFYALDSKFYNNFDTENKNHCRYLDMLFQIEDTLAEMGELSQDNAHIICRKPKSNRG
jgi:ubiquinone/menaquinone biosynthesis C-methylase UbiE